MSQSPPILYTLTDEAPALATHVVATPIIQAFARRPRECGWRLRDISLAGRSPGQLQRSGSPTNSRPTTPSPSLGELAKTPEANIIKLPNISASIPQMKAAIAELQARATTCRTTRRSRRATRSATIKARYDKVKGSAVNPVLREGNSDRRAPKAVKEYAKQRTRTRMRAWSPDSKSPCLDDERRRLPLEREVS